jgi:hypothetical protein
VLDLSIETPLPLKSATALVPPGRSGQRTHPSTLLRWIVRGAKAPSGDRVRLEAVRLGGKWVTSREAIQRFAEQLTPRFDSERLRAPRTPAQRRRADERADRELKENGL